MAENETLDIKISPRWRRICRAFQSGEPEERMVRRMQRALYGFVRHSIKNIADEGVSLDQLLHTATECPASLRKLFLQCKKQHDFVRSIAEVAEPGIARQELLRRTLDQVWDRLVDQFAHEVVPSGNWPDFHAFHQHLRAVHDGVRPDMERIARLLSVDSNWEPRRPPNRNRTSQVEETKAILAESLLPPLQGR